jgi:hypothetical protein
LGHLNNDKGLQNVVHEHASDGSPNFAYVYPVCPYLSLFTFFIDRAMILRWEPKPYRVCFLFYPLSTEGFYDGSDIAMSLRPTRPPTPAGELNVYKESRISKEKWGY